MNVSELARQLSVHPQKLLQVLPEFGFDIGARAVKIDDRVAQQIKKEWRRIKFILEDRERLEREKQRELEKQARQSSGQTVKIPPKLTVKQLSEILGLPINKLILELMKNGILASQNQNIDYNSAVIMAEELGFKVEAVTGTQDEEVANEHIDRLEKAMQEKGGTERAPVIVVMGHVDHGKTKLLDTIRSTNVMGGEAGGITQHIGAYQVQWKNPKTKKISPITFIDTPGHEAFTVMRSRGAKVADMAILVVAADDGVKPQTVEAINIIKAAKLPLVVAINKIDKPAADIERVKGELGNYNIIPEEWGGETPVVGISAKDNINIDKLLDNVLILADVNAETIIADAKRSAAGTVIEARVDKGEGAVVTILVQTGTLRTGDPLVVNGEIYGKVRALKNYRGETIPEAGPSTPVRILGFKIAPQVGDILDLSQESTSKMVNLKTKRTEQTGAEQKVLSPTVSAEDEANKQVLNVLVKADTLGSLEAVIGSLERIQSDDATVKVVRKGLGNIMADDVTLAETTNAIIFGFNVITTPIAHEMIQKSGVRFEQFKVIYDLLNRVRDELEKILNPELVTTELGIMKILAIFRTDRSSMIVGGRVESGKLQKDCKVRVRRGKDTIGLGKLSQLQSGKQAVNEVPGGSECGVHFEGKIKIEVGDILEAYKEEKKVKKLVLN